LADPNTRQGKRTPVTLKIKFKSETLEQFIERYAVDVSQGGIFIRTKEPLSVGTQMKFEFQLRDASPLIAGEGTVVWTRENDPSRPAIAPGMGVRFDRLAEGSQQVLEKILAEKAKQAPSRGNESPTKPPMFTDTPTRVAPAPLVAEALGEKPRARRDSEQTPLPNPVPFHSDADDFDESAFAEATKVRSLDELAAQTAGFGAKLSEKPAEPAPAEKAAEPSDDTKTATKALPADELAERRQSARADSTIADPPAPAAEMDRESAPVLPSPPEPEAKKAEDEKKSEAPSTKPGVEPAKAATARKDKDKDKDASPAVATETAKPAAPSRPSSMPVVLGILALVVLAAGGVYFFVLRDTGDKTEAVVENTGSAGSADVVTNTGSGSADVVEATGSGSAGSADVVTNNGSAGSAVAMTGSAGSAAAPVEVKTVIASNVAKGAKIEIIGTDQKGPAPLTAKLEKDKAYKARITAPGFVAQEIDVKGGQGKVTAKLVAKQKTLSIVTDPAGADVYVDGVMTGKITPSDVELTPAQAARARNRITLKRPGYKPVDQYLDASSWNEGDSRMTGKLTVKLVVQPKVVPPPPPTGSGDAGTGSGSATPSNTGGGAGSSTSTTTTPPPPPPPPSGSGSAEAPAPLP
jgi:uncharacterized protein (TIGR02266 family)